MKSGDNVRTAWTPFRFNNEVPLKVTSIDWNSPNQMLFLGLEYSQKEIQKSPLESLKMALKFGYS